MHEIQFLELQMNTQTHTYTYENYIHNVIFDEGSLYWEKKMGESTLEFEYRNSHIEAKAYFSNTHYVSGIAYFL